jgi:hypothetical protein
VSRYRKRGGYVTCETEVEIHVSEVLEQVSDADLIEEMDARKIERKEEWEARNAPTIEELQRVVDCLHRGWHQEALVRCERMLDAVTRANVPLSRVPELKALHEARLKAERGG